MSLVEQELPTLPEHLSSPPGFSGVHVTRSLVLYVCFVDHCLSFCLFSFDHCVVCSSSIYGFWLTLWYLQALLTIPFDRFVWFRWYIYPYATRVILCNYTHFVLNLNRNSFYLYKKYYTIIVFCWGQYEFLWTLKTIFTEAFRLRWILIYKVHKNSYWPIQKTVIVLLH